MPFVKDQPTVAALAEQLNVTEKTIRNCVNRSETLTLDHGNVIFQNGKNPYI